MGCDIHEHFEVKQDGKWVLVFPARPSHYWYESMIDEKVENGSAQLAFAESDPEIAGAMLEGFYEMLDINDPVIAQEIVERYGNDKGFDWEFAYPKSALDASYGPYATIGERDYSWFASIAGVRGEGTIDPRGLPEDCTKEVRAKSDHDGLDGHSHSWLGVQEMLDHPDLQGHSQLEWLRKNIPDPQNSRMVFWFDN